MDPDILKKRAWEEWRRGTLCWPPWLADEGHLGFRWSTKAKTTIETISFGRNSTFIHNERLLKEKKKKKKEKKTLLQQSIRKEKLRKVGLCFISGYFIKPFKMTINHFSSVGLLVHKIFLLFRSQRSFRFLISG